MDFSTPAKFESSTLSAGSPVQFHDAVDRMDHTSHVQHGHGHDDTLGGLDASPHLGSGSAAAAPVPRERRHYQSQSLDHGLTNSPRAMDRMAADEAMDSNQHQQQHLRYATPPLPQNAAPSISRPPSGLSGSHQQQYQQQPSQQQQQQQQQSYDPSAAASSSSSAAAASAAQNGRNHVVIKVGMVGDAQIGKTSLMVKYVEGSWDEDYIQTLGVNFMEKTISIRNTEITFSIWDLGGQREFVNMLPLVCNDAVAILFMFDLTRKSTLNSIKEWYRQGRGFNKTAIPILVGTKYDHFVNFPREDQEEISLQVRPPARLRGIHASGRLLRVVADGSPTRRGDSQRPCAPRSYLAALATASMSKR